VWIVPLFSWYSPLLEAQPPQFNVKEETARWMDFTLWCVCLSLPFSGCGNLKKDDLFLVVNGAENISTMNHWTRSPHQDRPRNISSS